MKAKNQYGLTLIEMMIVVAIVGILAAIVYPSYQEQIQKSRRTDGVTMLNMVMQAQERNFVNNFTYTTDLTDLGFASASAVDSPEDYYKISAAACAGTTIAVCVNLTVTPQGGQTADGNLTLDSRGAKTPSGKW